MAIETGEARRDPWVVRYKTALAHQNFFFRATSYGRMHSKRDAERSTRRMMRSTELHKLRRQLAHRERSSSA